MVNEVDVMNKLKKVLRSKGIFGLIGFIVVVALFLNPIGVQLNQPIFNTESPTIGIGGNQVVFTIGNEVSATGTADYTCDGTDDDVQFQAALEALPIGGGQLIVLSGNYLFSTAVSRAIDNVTIEGMGLSTYISRDGVNPIFTTGVQSNWTFSNIRFDAGGVNDTGSFEVTYENVDIGGTHWAYDTSSDISGASWDIPTGRGATLIVAASDAYPNSIAQADYWCDGIDDQVQIQAALDALPASGGMVQLTEGTFVVDHQPDATYSVIAMVDDSWLRGMGAGTVIKLVDNAVLAGETGHPIIETYDEVALTLALNWKVSDLQIDGNKTNQTPDTAESMNVGIWVRQQTTNPGNIRVAIDNVIVHDTISGGFYFEEIRANRYEQTNTLVTNCVAYDTGLVAVLTTVGGFHFDNVAGVHLINCIAFDNYRGAQFNSGSYNQLKNFQTYGNVTGVSVYEGGDESIGNRIEIMSYEDTVYGLFLNGGAGNNDVYDNFFTGTIYSTGASAGIWGINVTRNIFEIKVIGDGTGGGAVFQDSEHNIFDLDVYKAGTVGASFGPNAHYNTIRGSYIECGQQGIFLNGDYNTVQGVIVMNNSQNSNNSYSELAVAGDYNTITGSVCRSTLGTKAKYSYQDWAGSISNILIGNVFEGAVSGAMSLETTTKAYEKHTDLFMDVLAVDATHVRSNEDLSAGVPITFTIDAQPDVPRTLSGHFDANVNITAYTIDIVGFDAKGALITETLTDADGWDWETSNAFSTITSIVMSARTGTGVGDTMDIGITDVIGLSNVIYATDDVYKIKRNNANATVAVAQVDIDYDTYDMSVIGLNATDDFTIWFRSSLNIIQ